MRYTLELEGLGTARIVGWAVLGMNPRTDEVEMANYEADESWRANEHAMRLEHATMAPII